VRRDHLADKLAVGTRQLRERLGVGVAASGALPVLSPRRVLYLVMLVQHAELVGRAAQASSGCGAQARPPRGVELKHAVLVQRCQRYGMAWGQRRRRVNRAKARRGSHAGCNAASW